MNFWSLVQTTLQATVLSGFLLGTSMAGAQGTDDGQEFSNLDNIADRLAVVQTKLAALPIEADSNTRMALEELAADLYQHREAVEDFSTAKQLFEQQRTATQDWRAFSTPPPYSVLLSEELRSQNEKLLKLQQSATLRTRIIDRALEDAAKQFALHQQSARSLREDAQSTADPGLRTEILDQAALAELRAQAGAETLARLRIRRQSQDIQLLALAANLELYDKKMAKLSGNLVFESAELTRILADLQQQRSKLLRSLVHGAKGSKAGDQHTWKLDVLELQRDLWTALYAAMNAEERAERNTAVAAIEAILPQAKNWAAAISLFQQKSDSGDNADNSPVATKEDIQMVLGLEQQAIAALAIVGTKSDVANRFLNNVAEAALAVWHMELYLAEQTVSVAGQRVPTYSAVTPEKLVRLIFIFVVGWFVFRFLANSLRRLVSMRAGVSPATANSVGSWTFGLGIALLLVIALNRVHIPLTAFAFMGGTLAIGIGFGAQTLLKNFISGIIISLERTFTVGDLVDIDGLQGTIAKIGMRASVISHFDGIETLVPNADLLENRVSSWTYSDGKIRGSIFVGVAYGSPVRAVAAMLADVAQEHGLVLKHPVPEVRLINFGDNALEFELLFWIDTNKCGREVVSSDLRFMIERTLADAGIEISFPQRDVHFNTSTPIQVELKSPTS